MKRNEKNSQERTKVLVEAYIAQELALFEKASLGYTSKYFRYVHLGNRIVRKINSAKNGTFILISKNEDVTVTIKKGTGIPVTTVEIKHKELCFKKDSNNTSLKYF